MNELERYVAEEHIEDFRDGLIDRRELIRRVSFITGSAAAVSALAALGCNVATESPAPRASGSAPAAAASAAATPRPFATPPPAPTTDGITVKPDDPRIQGAGMTTAVKAKDGSTFIAYMARPAGSEAVPAVLAVHENRGILEHNKDVVRRLATAGYVALTIDLLSRDGGADKLTDAAAYSAALAKRTPDDMVADLRAALDYLNAQSFVKKDILGMTGFCFGGGVTWSTVISGAPLKAAVPYYGPMPAKSDDLAKTKTAVFAVYAELDTRITGTAPQMEALLKASGSPYKITVYPGVNHAFHNDTNGPDRYGPVQAQKAWVDTIEWFRLYLK